VRPPVDEIRLRLDGAQALGGGGRVLRLDVERTVGGRDHGNDAAFAPGRVGTLERDGGALPPVVRGRKAVVDDHEKRRPAAVPGGRVPDRPGGRDDQQRGDGEPKHEQPPGRARRRFPLRQQVHEDAQGRKGNAPGLRRRHAQKQPDRRQRGQGRQNHRRREGQRKAEHPRHPCRTGVSMVPREAATKVRSRNAASLAGRSV
jgi:hypothetical protein